jgi:hypothetical protein
MLLLQGIVPIARVVIYFGSLISDSALIKWIASIYVEKTNIHVNPGNLAKSIFYLYDVQKIFPYFYPKAQIYETGIRNKQSA